MSFFTTPEFLFLKQLRERLTQINTENNYKIYKDHLELCKKKALSDYNNIGWRKDTETYAWAEFDESQFSEKMISFGGYNEGSFYKGHTLYMSEDYKTMALKDEEGNVFRYKEQETDKIRDLSIKELQKIHEIKIEFEGEIINGNQEGIGNRKQNKKISVRF